jgi:cohesin complex subunit SA-1/2
LLSTVSYPEEKEEKPVKRRGRPRKVRDEPPARNLFDGHNSSDEESVSGSDQRGHGGDDDDDDDDAFDQPLINTFRPSASKLRSLSSQKNAPRASGKEQDPSFTSLLSWPGMVRLCLSIS